MALKTRKPTGKPPWPIVLIAGVQKAGKSYAAAQASASDLIGRTLYIPVGEDDPDELGAIDGARFEIVMHDGTYRGIYTALAEAVEELAGEKKPGLIVIDSGTRLWNLLSDEVQATANDRAARKAKRNGRAAPTEDVQPSMDLWNRAKNRWEAVIDLLRDHRGPSIITARLERVAVMQDGAPNGEHEWKVQAHKSLPWDVGAIVQMPDIGQAYLTGVRSLRVQGATKALRPFPDFTMDALWREMGLADGATERSHTGLSATRSVAADETHDNETEAAKRRLWAVWQKAERGDGDALVEAFEQQYALPIGDADASHLNDFADKIEQEEAA